MDYNDFKKIILKYSWLLILYYLIVIGIPKISTNILYVMTDSWGISAAKAGTYMLIFKWVTYLLNLIIALIMYIDYKKYEIKNAWTVILTILYIPVGVCIFFVNIFFSKKSE